MMVTSWAARSLWRRLLVAITGRPPRVEGTCRRCGNCCSDLVLRSDGRWICTPEQFTELLIKEPAYERMRPKKRDADGRMVFQCTWLGPDRLCRCYRDRLPVCRSHPGPSLWLRGVDLPATCGYRLIGPTLFGFMRKKRPPTTEHFVAVFERELARNGDDAHSREES